MKTTVRNVTGLTIQKNGDEIIIRVTGMGFLYNMVRIIAGTLMEVGCGKYPPVYVKEILEARDRKTAGNTAPARGLTLVGVRYFSDETRY